jgi:hypothetical protein
MSAIRNPRKWQIALSVFILLGVCMFEISQTNGWSSGPPRAVEPAKSSSSLRTAFPLLAEEEGCAKDYAKALELDGLDRRKALRELITYNCVHKLNGIYLVSSVESGRPQTNGDRLVEQMTNGWTGKATLHEQLMQVKLTLIAVADYTTRDEAIIELERRTTGRDISADPPPPKIAYGWIARRTIYPRPGYQGQVAY